MSLFSVADYCTNHSKIILLNDTAVTKLLQFPLPFYISHIILLNLLCVIYNQSEYLTGISS